VNLCVFCASSAGATPGFARAAQSLGTWIGRSGHTLVWGGCNVGLMDILGRATRAAGGRTVAVIPEFLVRRGLAFEGPDDRIVTADMAARKAEFRRRAHAYVALPGGIGTWEELFEVLALRKLGQLDAPIVVVNVEGCFDALLAQLERSVRDGLTAPEVASLLEVAPDAEAAIHILERSARPA
jgi:hypothetical protein